MLRFLLLSSLLLPFTSSALASPSPIRAAFWPSDSSPYSPSSSLNASLFTHLIYSFASINASSSLVQPDNTTLLSPFSPSLRSQNPNIKTLLAIGGAAANLTVIGSIMSSPASRSAFVQSSIAVAREYGLDGLNLDWEFPNSEAQMQDLRTFFAEWRTAVNAEANASEMPPLLLTAAVYYSSKVPSYLPPVGDTPFVSYPIDSIVQNLDWVTIMTFDYHGKWENFTGEHTAFSSPGSNLSTEYGLAQWFADGLPQNMTVVGLASYGRSWLLLNESNNGIGVPAAGPGPIQNISNEEGIFLFFEIENFISSQNPTIVYDNTTDSTYCYSGDIWIGYDDAFSISSKVTKFSEMKTRGYFFWAVSYDANWTLSTAAFSAWDKAQAALVNSTTPSSSSSNSNLSSSLARMIWTSLLLCSWIFLSFP